MVGINLSAQQSDCIYIIPSRVKTTGVIFSKSAINKYKIFLSFIHLFVLDLLKVQLT